MSEIKDVNFKVVAKFWFREDKFDQTKISLINNIISEYMLKQGFYNDDYRYTLLNRPLFETEFYIRLTHRTPSVTMRLQKLLGFKSQEEIENSLEFESLRNSLDDHPYKVTFWVNFEKIRENVSGYVIKIEIEPIILIKKRKIHYKPKLNQTKYNNIIEYNKAFINNIIACFGGAGILEEPKAIEHLELKQSNYLFEDEFLLVISKDIRECLIEANKCYSNECNRATSIMIRKSLEIAIIKKFYQTGNESRLYTESGEEISLNLKLKILREIIPKMNKYIKDIEIVKWFGDNNAHDPNSIIFARDIEHNIVPKTRAFLMNLELK